MASIARYTQRAFPAYRFVPGRAPHPTRDSAGHSFGAPPTQLPAFVADDWAQCEVFLYGIDLFNHGYWWEAHEALEAVWVAAGRRTPTGRFLQGLIQISVAHLKKYQGFDNVAVRMATDGLAKLGGRSGTMLGIERARLRADIEAYFTGARSEPVTIRLQAGVD